MTLDAAYAGRLRQISELPQARPPSTLGDVWQAEWAASGLDTFDGVGQPMLEARRELLERLESVTGKSLAELSRESGVRLVGPGGERAASDAFTALAARLPEDQRKQIEPYADIIGNARTKAREIEKRAEDVGASTYGLSGYATSFAAGISRQMVSPVNIALMPLGGPLTGSGVRGVGMMLAREAGYGMAAQALQEPVIAAGREQLGLESSSIENIVQAGIGQAAFAGVFRAGAAGLRAFSESRALAAEGLTRETAPLARALEQDLANPFATRPPTDQAGRLVMDAPRLDLPEGVRIEGRAGSISDNLSVSQGPVRLGAELNAPASVVEFGRFEQNPQLRDVPDLSRQLRDVATRLEPEDLDAIALLEERNAVMDAQARALVPAPRVPQPTVRRPVSMAEFIGRNGGLALDSDAKALGLDRMFIPRGGPVARKSGRPLDWWINKLTEEGYLDAGPDGYARADLAVYDDIRNALRDEATLKQRRYRRADEEAAAQFQTSARAEAENARWEAELAYREDDVRRALSSVDDDLSAIDARDISRAAELLARGDVEDAIAAFDRAAMERLLNDPEIAPIVAPVYREFVPGFDDADFSPSAREGRQGPDDGSFPGDRPGQEAAPGRSGGNDAPSGQGSRPQSLDEAALLSGDAIDSAAAALERGRAAPQPLAFQPTSVTARVDLFQPQTRFELAVAGRPDLGAAVKAAMAEIKASALPVERVRAEVAIVDQSLRVEPTGPFGPVISGLAGRFADAVLILSRAKAGEALDVLQHPLLDAPVSLIWGKPGRSGFGLSHILSYADRADLVKRLPIEWPQLDTKVVQRDGSRVELSNAKMGVVVRLDRDGEAGSFIVTAYEKRQGGQRADGTAASVGESGRAGQSPDPLAAPVLQSDALASNPFARVFFADDAMTVRVPDDVAQSRIARAAERAASAEASGAPAWSLEGIARLAARIDTAPGDLPRIADKPPRQAEAVRVRVKDASANAGDPPPQPSPARGEGAALRSSSPKGDSALTMKQQRVIATVERQLAEMGDARIVMTGPDGREVTSARALLARVADDEAAVRELDACIASGGARSSSPQGGSGGITS